MRRWMPLWVVPVIIAMAIGTVWLRLTIIRTTYSINETEKMIRNTRRDKEQLELKLANLRSPRRLEALAKTKFNLQQPKADQVVHLK